MARGCSYLSPPTGPRTGSDGILRSGGCASGSSSSFFLLALRLCLSARLPFAGRAGITCARLAVAPALSCTGVRPPFTWPLEPNVSTASSPSKAAHECGSEHRLVHRRCGTLGEHTHTDIHQDAHSVISKTSPQIFVLDSSTFPGARPS